MDKKENNPSVDQDLSAEIKEAIKHTIRMTGPQLSKEEKREHANLLSKIFNQGFTGREAMGLTNSEVGMIYSFGFQLFAEGKYPEAKEIFKMLTLLDPVNGDFATGLGACFHRLNEYEPACQAYMMAAYLDPENPVPLMYTYDCLLKLNESEGAVWALEIAHQRAEKHTKYAKIREQAQQLLDSLKKQDIEKGAQTK